MKYTDKHYETEITLDVHIMSDANGESSHINLKTNLTLSEETVMHNLYEFEQKATKLLNRAKREVKNGKSVCVDITKAKYSMTSYDDIKQCTFEMWSGWTDDISDDGIHLSPSGRFNENQCHDMFLSGKRGELFSEMTI